MNDGLFSEADLDPELIELERRKENRERQNRIEQKRLEEEKAKEKESQFAWDKTLYLLDGYSIIYRNYFAHISRPITDRKGNNVSAYFGFFQTLFSLMSGYPMDGLAVTMDEKELTFRHKMFPEYKANREKAPDDLHAQVPMIKDTLKKMNIPVLSNPGFEADDIMASASRFANENGWNVVIVTGDKDLCQLVGDHVHALRPPKKAETKYVMMDREAVKESYGVYPEQIVDYLSIIGDSADNVPGILGLGEKGAVKLLTEYLSFDGVYRHLDSISKGTRAKLEAGKEMGELSRELIKLCFDALPEGFDLNALDASRFTIAAGAPDFEERNLRSLVARASGGIKKEEGGNGEEAAVEKPVESLLRDNEKYLLEKGTYDIIQDAQSLEKMLKRVEEFGSKTLSVEFLSEGYQMGAKVLGVALSAEPLKATYVPFGDGVSLEDFKRLADTYLASGRIGIVAHSAKSALNRAWDLKTDLSISFDTMLAAWMLSSNDGIYSLEFTVSRYFSQTLLSLDDLRGDDEVSTLSVEAQMRYAAARADYTSRLYRVFERRLHERSLWEPYASMELPLLRVLGKMEREGIYLSLEAMAAMKSRTQARLAELTSAIYALAGYEFNINSTRQLAKVLFEERGLEHGKKTQSGYSTDTATLEGLKSSGDPIIALILEYRQLSKLMSTYIETLPTLRDGQGRIHTSFLQTGTATGRLSSRNPNLQNIPIRTDEGRLIRSAFIPKEGSVFISADYSQVELVVLSWMAEDPGLQAAFLSGQDVHRYTAAMIFGKDVVDVEPQERRVAKTINFGIMYGMSAFRLSNELEISRTEAASFIQTYFERYNGVKSFVEKTNANAEKLGYVTTNWGHVREILGINSRNKTEKAAAERTAVNTVIQGTAAEIMKKAMVKLASLMEEKGVKSKLLLQVHDELIFEVPMEEVEMMKALVQDTMEHIVALPVPLKVSVEEGHSWGDMH